MTKSLGRTALLVVVTYLAVATATAPAAVAQTASGPATRAGGAPADPAAATAKEHYLKGGRFYDLGKYDDAIREFEAAYENRPDPAFLYNLAQSHRLAGHNNDAIRFY